MDDDQPFPYDELVKVAYADDSLEGQMIVGMLESEGIECLQLDLHGNQIARATALGEYGFGPRRVMVRADQAERAASVIERQLSQIDEHEAREAPEPSDLQ